MKHRLAGALRKTQIQCPIRSTSTPSDAHGNGHALIHRATKCASILIDVHGNGHALNLRATICASIPSDAQGNGHALNLRATIYHFGVDLPHRFVVESLNCAEDFDCRCLVVSKPLHLSQHNYFWHYII
jgi:hypothetical protein